MVKTDPQTGIIYRRWQASSPQAVFLLMHGLGAHSGRWEALADYFSQNKFSLYALELRGFGLTPDLKGHVESFRIYFQDILTLLNIIKQENSGKKVFLVGESFGGLLSFLFSSQNQLLFDGLILISPAFNIKMRIPFWDYVKSSLYYFINPRKQLSVRFTGAMCTRDTRYQKQLDADPLEHRKISAKFTGNYFAAEAQAGKFRGKWRMPVLFLIPGQDKIINSQRAEIIFRRLDGKDKEIIEYPQMYHALTVDLGKEKVFADILNWAQKRL